MPNQNSGWFPDPSGEHQHRYYDGDNWTDMVGDNGIRSNSPLGRKVTIDRSLPRIQQIPYQHVTRNKDLAATPDYYAVAMTMLDNDNLSGAEQALVRAEAEGDVDACLELGLLFKRTGRFDDAIAAYRRGQALKDGRSSCNLAALLMELGDRAGAKDAYLRADSIKFAGGSYGLAQMLRAEGDIQGSIDANRRGDEWGHGDCAFNLGILLNERNDCAGAAAAFGRAADRGVQGAVDAMGRALEKMGDLTGAEDAYVRADLAGDGKGSFDLGALLYTRALAAFERADERKYPGADVILRKMRTPLL